MSRSTKPSGHNGHRLALVGACLVVAIVPLALPDRAHAVTLPAGFTSTEWVTGLARPYQMAFAPDGRLFVSQQGGKLRVIKNGTLLSTPFLAVTVDSAGDRGLIGVAFDPNFAVNQYVYVYYTTPSPTPHNRVSRFRANGDVAVAGSEQILLELDNLGTASLHNGGAIHFGRDGKLYIATGENVQGTLAQSMTSLLGKMLRINPDGTIPTDNPFYATATGKYRAIWALGLRNPFTFAIQPGSGRTFINDVGASRWEEINDGVAGANYGWPTTEGPTTDPRFVGPIFAYGHGSTSTTGCAIAGGTFYNPPTARFPADYVGDYFFADNCSGWIRRLDPAAGNAVTGFATGYTGPVDVKTGPDGSLYVLTRDCCVANNPGVVHKVQYSGAPAISSHPANVTVAPGQSASFTVTASGQQPLNYQWRRNGVKIRGATSSTYTLPSVTAADDGAQFHVVVRNSVGTATSNAATLRVSANSPPAGTIASPAPGTTYNAGTTLTFTGTATDAEDGTLPASAFSWNVQFHHNTHTHPGPAIEPGPTGDGRSGRILMPDEGETDTDVFYRVSLTVRDSTGATHTTHRDVLPNVSTITLQASPPTGEDGLQVTLDGQPHVTPYSTPSVVGIKRTIGAVSPQTSNGTAYVFSSWSDGGASVHTIATPSSDTAYTATYTASTDTAPPETSITSGPAATNDTTPTFAFASSEAGSTFECKVDAGAFAACTSPTTLPTQTQGQHTFSVRAVDGAGNVDATPAARAFTIDSVAPSVSVSTPAAGATVSGTVALGANASDAVGVVATKWYVDNVEVAFDGDGAPWTRTWDSRGVADGSHRLFAKARDAAGNWGTSAVITITVANAATGAPDTAITAGPTSTNDTTVL